MNKIKHSTQTEIIKRNKNETVKIIDHIFLKITQQ